MGTRVGPAPGAASTLRDARAVTSTSARSALVSILIGAAIMVHGCASPPLPLRPPPPVAPAKAACPLGVDGATVVAEDTLDGAALVFASPGDGNELRERARRSASMRGPYGHRGLGHDGHHGGGGHHGLQAASLPAARATARDVRDGARIDLVPTYPADLDALRAAVRERASRMTTRPCDH